MRVDVSQLNMVYLGGERVAANGSQACTLSAGTNCVWIYAEGGAIYWAINPSGDAAATSPGYCPSDGVRVIGPLSNLTSLKVYGGGATVYAHLEYYAEA